jgi:hypothetical protein
MKFLIAILVVRAAISMIGNKRKDQMEMQERKLKVEHPAEMQLR